MWKLIYTYIYVIELEELLFEGLHADFCAYVIELKELFEGLDHTQTNTLVFQQKVSEK